VGKKKKFNDHPFGYHEEIELEIATLTNLGLGLGRVELSDRNPEPRTMPAEAESTGLARDSSGNEPAQPPSRGGWVVMVPFTLPGERVRARVFRNHKNFSEADLMAVLNPSPDRVEPRCPLFGRCGGCQYQHLNYAQQLEWKRRQVAELLEHMAGLTFPVSPVVPSPREYGYRSKITPHFAAPLRPAKGSAGTAATPLAAAERRGTESAPYHANEDETLNSEPITVNASGGSVAAFPIGFLRQGTRFDIVDVPNCPIATEAINLRLGAVRQAVHAKAASYTRGATLLLREASGEVTTDYDAIITETVDCRSGSPAPVFPSTATRLDQAIPPYIRLHFLARDFFQNNPFILPAFTGYVREQAAGSGARFLVDAYCGSGLFALTAASAFERVAGVEISESSVRFARENATANGISNATFLAADAAAIFAGLEFPAPDTAVIIDPPRKGCDESFLRQLFAFGPKAVVYVSCDPATQMRDLRHFLTAGYTLKAAQPFDLFPQTRHLECVLTLVRS
jgi:23S rRNA (uracil1939-C5)-methyltransferase/tRNA (uracil-5-)-methyltransferase